MFWNLCILSFINSENVLENISLNVISSYLLFSLLLKLLFQHMSNLQSSMFWTYTLDFSFISLGCHWCNFLRSTFQFINSLSDFLILIYVDCIFNIENFSSFLKIYLSFVRSVIYTLWCHIFRDLFLLLLCLYSNHFVL